MVNSEIWKPIVGYEGLCRGINFTQYIRALMFLTTELSVYIALQMVRFIHRPHLQLKNSD